MCLKHIGKTVDIHGGGTELVFPHHENEILQSEAFNDAQFVRFWMHNGLLTIDEEKMSKSLKNFFSIKDILTRFSPEVVRFFILNASYRQPLDYTEKSLEETGKALERLQKTYDSMESALKTAAGNDDATAICEKAWKQFEERMDDDFSTREAAAVMYDLAREANKLQSEGGLSKKGAENIIKVFDDFDGFFGVLRKMEPAKTDGDSSIDLLVKARNDARRRKDFSEADRIRKELAELGVDIQDTKDGTVWKRK
jgi:cysteinyl-tRNA synthetase